MTPIVETLAASGAGAPATGPAPYGVLLMTYGSPSNAAEVPGYLVAVHGGRPVEQELIDEFTRRYEVIGWSPLIPLTVAQADALDARLGDEAIVRAAMRFSEPSITTVLREFVDAGVREVVAVILSPQYSPLLMGGYARDLDAACAALGDRAPAVRVAGAWHLQPDFIAAVGERIREGLSRFPAAERSRVPVLLTAHSLPRTVAEKEPGYLAQLADTASAVAAAAGLADGQWQFCWQSAGHEPGEWMTPDFKDLMPGLRAAGHDGVLVAPIQFLSEHLETLYDVGIGAREEAEEQGLAFERIEALNTLPRFIDGLAAVVRETRAGAAAG